MKKRFILCLIAGICGLSTMTLVLLLSYLDPYEYTKIGTMLLIGVFTLWCSSTAACILYIIKKIYYRGSVGVHHVISSFRQGFFLSICCIIIVLSNYFGMNVWINAIGIIVLCTCLELFLKNMQE